MKPPIDPEQERWNRKYPRFPGVAKCVELLKSRNVQGAWIDIICYELEQHSEEKADELIAATRAEIDRESGVARILLNVMIDAKLPAALPLFAELLDSSEELLRLRGINGLENLDTKEARQLLWEHGESDAGK